MKDLIVKDVVIARSGLYEYSRKELASLGLKDIPKVYDGIDVFKVYRPASVLMAAHDKFTKLPITREHVAWINPQNYRDHVIGWTGDSSTMLMSDDKSEVIIKSSANVADAEGIAAYDSGIREVSPGYSGHFVWKEGAYQGREYQIVMDSISEVNHLALTVQGRGGPDVKIADSRCDMKLKEKAKKFASGLWHAAKKLATGVTDSDLGAFRAKVEDLVGNRPKLDDAGIKTAVDELKGYLGDLPESEDKGTLERVLEDFGVGLKDQDDATAAQAGKMVADLFEKLDGDAMADVSEKEEPPAQDGVPDPDKPKDEPASPAGGSGAGPDTPKTPTDKKPEDGAPDPAAHAEPDGDEPLSADEIKAPRALLTKGAAPDGKVGDSSDPGEGAPSGDRGPDDGTVEDSAGAFKTSVGATQAGQGLKAFLDSKWIKKGGK
jgi:hypothetical protein